MFLLMHIKKAMTIGGGGAIYDKTTKHEILM